MADTNEMSTAASVAPGLNRFSRSPPAWAVAPWAKYQFDAVSVAQGAMLHPSGLDTACDTATPPPSRTTAAASTDDDPSWSSGTLSCRVGGHRHGDGHSPRPRPR